MGDQKPPLASRTVSPECERPVRISSMAWLSLGSQDLDFNVVVIIDLIFAFENV